MTLFEQSGADFNADRTHRLRLWRTWDASLPPAVFVGMNPSDADEHRLDRTTAKCRSWSQAWGYGGFVMLNAGTRVETHPERLILADRDDVCLPENYATIRDEVDRAGIVVACWGCGGPIHALGLHLRAAQTIVTGAPAKLHYLRLSRDGHPWHPLYLPNATTPQRWERPYGL